MAPSAPTATNRADDSFQVTPETVAPPAASSTLALPPTNSLRTFPRPSSPTSPVPQPQGASLKAQVLRWEDDHRRLVTSPADTVELSRDDGSLLTGAGLELLDVRKTIRCSGPISGTLVADTAEGE